MTPIYANLDKTSFGEAATEALRQVHDAIGLMPERVLKPAVKAGLLILKKAAKANDWKGKYGTGLLKLSLTEKVVYKAATKTVTGMVGAKRGMKRAVTIEIKYTDKRTGRVRNFTLQRFEDPAKYLHLVEHDVKPHFQPLLNIMHPGTRGKGFLGDAMDLTMKAVEARFVELIPPLIRQQQLKN